MSASIILILSAILIIRPHRSSETFELANAAQKFVSDVQRLQGFALATANFAGDPLPTGGGWGMYVSESEPCYIIFADVGTPNTRYDGPGGALCDPTLAGGELLERVFLPSRISFESGSFAPTGLAVIIFVPPRPNVFFVDNVGNVLSGSSASINLEISLIGTQKTITINSVGNVSVN